MNITRMIATALFAIICTLAAFWSPAHADEKMPQLVTTDNNITVTVTVVTYTMVLPADQLPLFQPTPTATAMPVQEVARPQFIVVTATPEPGLWEKLSQSKDRSRYEQRNVGLNRLGTVAVLLGILAIIALLASAIVHMLRGR